MKALTAAEMREVDRLTTERHGISQLQLMETAGNKAADIVWRIVAGRERVRICVLCGKGNNGGDGFVAARRLKDSGVAVQVILFAAWKMFEETPRQISRAGAPRETKSTS